MFWTPRSTLSMRNHGALPYRRVRYPAPPRKARLVKAELSAKDFRAPRCLPIHNFTGSIQFYQVQERLFEPFPLSCTWVGDRDVTLHFQPQKSETQEASRYPRAAGIAGTNSGGAVDAGTRPFARGRP